MTEGRLKVFRWRAVRPLLVLLVLAGVAWALFAEELARRTSEDVGAQVVGARVDIERLDIDLAAGDVTLRGLTVASPFEAMRNLLQADELVADIDAMALLEKKVVIDRLYAKGLRFGTTRTTPGMVESGRVEAVRQEMRDFAARFEVPLLQLATGELSVDSLDPRRLESVRAADALLQRAESAATAWREAAAGLNVQATVDSTRALLERLQNARATDLRLVADARHGLDRVRRSRDRVTALERGLTDGVAALKSGTAALEQARRRDYAFARSLVRLPSLDAPDIAAALFAPVVIERFQRAVHWVELGRRYMPPGLRPQRDAGPPRVRRSGTTVRFPRERSLPAFLLREAELSFVLGAESDRPRTFAGLLEGLTSTPGLYGRPTVFRAAAPAVRLGALVDHRGASPRDTVGAEIAGVALPGMALGSLPVRLEPGDGTMGFRLALRGDTVRARWSVNAPAVRWVRDSAAPGAAGGREVAAVAWRVLSGITALDLSAELSGTLGAPRLSVRSNLDRAVGEGLRAAVGEEIAAAEGRLRAQVDRLAEERAAPLRTRVAAVEQEMKRLVAGQRSQVEQAQKQLDDRLRQLLRVP